MRLKTIWIEEINKLLKMLDNDDLERVLEIIIMMMLNKNKDEV